MKKSYPCFFLILYLAIGIISPFRPQEIAAQTNASPTPVDYKLPYPGLLPDHPLYPIKKIRDKILYILNPSPIKKIELNLLFADKKIGMAESLFEREKVELGLETLREGQNDLIIAASQLPILLKNNTLPVGLSDKIELAAKKHREILTNFSITQSDEIIQKKIYEVIKLNDQATQIVSSLKEK